MVSHRKFIAESGLHDITLLSDPDRRVIKLYGAKHGFLPVARRVYIVVDRNRQILFRQDKGFSLLEDQTQTLIDAIDKGIR